LKSTNDQENIRFDAKIYVDDGSVDGSADIAESLGWDVVRLKWVHENLVNTDWISQVFNKGLKRLYELTDDFDYLLVAPCDIILPPKYVYILIQKMKTEKVSIASGTIKGEAANPDSPVGAGRIYDGKFFLKHIRFFPRSVIWETWALFKASILGHNCKVYYDKDLEMTALRPTRFWKPFEGYAARQLGYFPPYIFARFAFVLTQNMKAGVKMIAYYLNTRVDDALVDEHVKQYLRYKQSRWLIKRTLQVVAKGMKR
jgi:glycosyltransferase involved in cell wall biosynthesis